MREFFKENAGSTRIGSLLQLDALVGEHVTGEIPDTQWEDSNALFRFDTEEEARAAIRNPYYQLFLPDVDWTATEVLEVSTFRPYSSDMGVAWEVVEKIGHHTLQMRRELGRWIASFDEHGESTARSAPVAICIAALRVRGIEVEIDPDLMAESRSMETAL